jgi:hypothetical protein
MTKRCGDGARRVIADLMAIAAAIGLDEVEPLVLGLKTSGMPLPLSPVPGKRLLSGTLIIEAQ